MPIRQLSIQLWRTHRVMLIVLSLLLLANFILFALVEQVLAPKVAALENHYIIRQAEVRQLLRHRTGPASTPEQMFVLASRDLADFTAQIPVYLDFTGLIEELLLLAKQANLNITRIAYEPSPVKGIDLLSYDLSFNLTGDYAQLKQFIHSLEQSSRLMVIREIGLQSAEGGQVSLRLKLETFFRAESPGDVS